MADQSCKTFRAFTKAPKQCATTLAVGVYYTASLATLNVEFKAYQALTLNGSYEVDSTDLYDFASVVATVAGFEL